MLRELETFLTVCRCGTFTAAGKRLGLTQSAVSDQMRRFEDFLGKTLFYRTGRSAALNAAGREMLPMAEEVADLMQRMRARAGRGPLQGSIRVGTVSSVHNTLVARAMIGFREAYPKVNVRLIRHEGSMLAQIEREELDLAVSVRPSTPFPGDMRWLPLLRKPFVLIAPAWIEAAHWREAMQSRPLLRYDGSTPSGLSVDAFLERTGAKVGDSIWINYLDTMISLVASGVGVALIPTSLFGEAAPAIRTFELGADTFYREVGVLWRPDTPQRGSINSLFIDTLAREAAREPLSECLIATRQSALA